MDGGGLASASWIKPCFLAPDLNKRLEAPSGPSLDLLRAGRPTNGDRGRTEFMIIHFNIICKYPK